VASRAILDGSGSNFVRGFSKSFGFTVSDSIITIDQIGKVYEPFSCHMRILLRTATKEPATALQRRVLHLFQHRGRLEEHKAEDHVTDPASPR
jgi:hypothetical protein